MASFSEAVKRLQIIYNECAPEDADGKKQTQRDLDDFGLAKKRLHKDVQEVRELLKEREELMTYKAGSKEAAEASYRIRLKIKGIKEDLAKLQTLQKQDERRKSSANVELAEKYRGRAEVITLAQKHIEELEMMEKKRFNDKVNSERSALMSGAISIKIDPTAAALSRNNNSSNYTSDLPPIDDDPEITSGLKDLNAQNNDLDKDLDEIKTNVLALKEIAIDMDTEMKKQNGMLDSIDKKVEHTQAHLSNINLKMKKAIDGVMKGDKFIVNSILLCIVLALAAFIGSQFLPKS